MAQGSLRHRSPRRRARFHRGRPTTDPGASALRLVGGGLAFVVLVVAFVAVTDVHADIGPLSLLGLAAFAGLLTVVVGGVYALLALVGRGERSVLVLATLPVWALALALVVVELFFAE